MQRPLSMIAIGLVAAGSMAVPAASQADRSADPPADRSAHDAAAELGDPVELTTGFYVDPHSNPKEWVNANSGDDRAQRIDEAIASQPMARWFGDWNTDIQADVSSYVGDAAAADKLPVLVAYNIPGRDCSGHSSGGAGSPAAYRDWISGFADAIDDRPALVVLEPDSLPQLGCLPNDEERRIRLEMIRYASEQFGANTPNTWVYLDAGTSAWIPADEMADRPRSAGLANVHGFSINVSNYYPTADSVGFGNDVNAGLGTDKPFVVDTSRNGNGSNGEWCNPAGRRLGQSAAVDVDGAEMALWVKVPGDSDGECGSAPDVPAGQFDPDLAIRLIEGS